mgnify:CR=1 FL=1
MSLQWYVVHAYSNYEHKVKTSLIERIKRFDLEAKFGEILVPTEEVVEMRDGQKRRSERKFFPGYVLVQMLMNDDSWYVVRNTPGVTGFVSSEDEREKRPKPVPLEDKEVDAILKQIDSGPPKVTIGFQKGQKLT